MYVREELFFSLLKSTKKKGDSNCCGIIEAIKLKLNQSDSEAVGGI